MGRAGQRVGWAVLADLEGRADHVEMATDLFRGGRVHPGLQIVDLQDLDVQTGLTGDRGEVRVEVEHARVGVAQESEAPTTECPRRARGGHPVADLPPGLSAGQSVLLAQQTADDV